MADFIFYKTPIKCFCCHSNFILLLITTKKKQIYKYNLKDLYIYLSENNYKEPTMKQESGGLQWF